MECGRALISAITTSSVLKKLMGVFAENVMAIASAPAEDRTMLVSPTGEVETMPPEVAAVEVRRALFSHSGLQHTAGRFRRRS